MTMKIIILDKHSSIFTTKKQGVKKEFCNGLKFEPAHLFLLSVYDPVVEKESILI